MVRGSALPIWYLNRCNTTGFCQYRSHELRLMQQNSPMTNKFPESIKKKEILLQQDREVSWRRHNIDRNIALIRANQKWLGGKVGSHAKTRYSLVTEPLLSVEFHPLVYFGKNMSTATNLIKEFESKLIGKTISSSSSESSTVYSSGFCSHTK